MRLLYLNLLLLLLLAVSKPAPAQNFFKDYKTYRLDNHRYQNIPQLNRSIKRMKQAFGQHDRQAHSVMLRCDTVYMVHYYQVESALVIEVIWNPYQESLSYRYGPFKPFTVEPDAAAYLKGYKPEFQGWVEHADTLSYRKFGQSASWFDAPGISFTVAIRENQHWRFISSSSFTNNVDKLR